MQVYVENRGGRRRRTTHSLVSCTACGYQIPGRAATCPRCGQPGPASQALQSAKKRRNLGKCFLGALIMLAGGFSFFYIPFPFNLVAGPTALILGAATASLWQCDHCGARVDRDALDCPRCALPFSA